MSRQIGIRRVAGVLAANDGPAAWNPAFDDPRWEDHCLCLDRDWQGGSAPVTVRTLLVLDDGYLHLAAWLSGPPWAFADAVPGRFRTGLWQRDVVELFLCDRDGGGYREYHLSPGGEWWMGCFSAPRVAAVEDALPGHPSVPASESAAKAPGNERRPEDGAGFRAPGVFVSTESDDDGWRGALSLPRDLLPPGFARACDAGSRSGGATGLSGNVAAIVGRQDRRFLSAALLPGERPDFHQPGSFSELFVSTPW